MGAIYGYYYCLQKETGGFAVLMNWDVKVDMDGGFRAAGNQTRGEHCGRSSATWVARGLSILK
jgi:hypothetical protein